MNEANGAVRTLQASIRWVVMFTGFKATQDYQPSSSAGEQKGLVEEVTGLCVAFHPHTDIRLFPQDREALLFWRARSTNDWVITRVTTAPNPDGLRTALEYSSIILSESQLEELECNPFRALESGVHDRVREQFLAGRFEPIAFDIPVSPSSVNGTGASRLPVADGAPPTPENVRALREYISHRSGGTPVTFATWWSSGGHIPTGYFDIVLRAESSEPLALRDAAEAVSSLAAETKASLPAPPAGDAVAADLVRSVAVAADSVIEAVGEASTRLNTEGQDLFRARMEDAARHAAKAASDLASLRRRITGMDTSLSEPGSIAVLTGLAARYEVLAQDLPKVRHPNPFASRPATNTADSRPQRPRPSDNTTNTKPSASVHPAVYAVPAAAAAAFAVWKLAAGGGSKPPAPTPKPVTTPVTVRATATPALPFAALQKQQDAVAEDAKQRAKEDARDAVGKSGKSLSSLALEKITTDAIRAAYKGKVPEAEYQKAFGGTPWTYEKFQQTLPSLTTQVHDAAVESAADAKIKATTQAATQATQDANRRAEEAAAAQKLAEEAERKRSRDNDADSRRSERSTRSERTRPTPEPTPRRQSTPKPKPTPTPRSAGSAQETGL